MTGERCRIEFAHTARDDLRDITEWYTTQQVPEVGTRLVAEIIARTSRCGARNSVTPRRKPQQQAQQLQTNIDSRRTL